MAAKQQSMAVRQPSQKTSNLLATAITLLLLFPAGSLAEKTIYAEDIKAAMTRHLATVIDESGLFQIHDEVKGEDLSLRFVQIHDPVRQIGSDVYFACTDFHVDGIEDKLYDIDFWLRIEEGELKVFQTKIHKEPRSSLLYGWYKHPRYTFVNDEVVYLYEDE